MKMIDQMIDNIFATHSGVRCRSCGDPIKLNDEFGRAERACRRCRGR
jgi:hypothetical protein